MSQKTFSPPHNSKDPVRKMQKKSFQSRIDNSSLLHKAVCEGDMIKIIEVLNLFGADVHKKIDLLDKNNAAPLHYAARYSPLNIIQLLIENGADVNIKAQDGVTPLHIAASYPKDSSTQDAGVVTYLIEKGAQVDAADVYGRIPLHCCAMRGNKTVCSAMLPHLSEILIRTKDRQGITALHMAAIYNQVDIARLLLQDERMDVMSVDSKLAIPLHYACAAGNIEIVKLLFSFVDDDESMLSDMVNAEDRTGNTCLHVAIDHDPFLNEDKPISTENAPTNVMAPTPKQPATNDTNIKIDSTRGFKGDKSVIMQEPAKQESANKRAAVVQFLLQKGAPVNCQNNKNLTPILLAAASGQVKILEILLRHEADCSAVDKNRRTAVYLAAEENNLDVLNVLLSHPEAKTLINVTDKNDFSPLHIAVQNGHLEIVQCLLKNGANVHSKNDSGETPLLLAAKQGLVVIVREIVKHDRIVVNDEDWNYNTALHCACRYGHYMVVKTLLELGADVFASNAGEWTPLDIAASNGWTKTCKVLLENAALVGSSINKTTPLHLAAEFGHTRVVELFLDWNVDITLTDADGNSCLDIAIDHNHVSIALLIINSKMWQKALRKCSDDFVKGCSHDSPMRKLIKKMPEVAERVFDRCITYSKDSSQENAVTFNYEFLDDTFAPWMKTKSTIEEDPRSSVSRVTSASIATTATGTTVNSKGKNSLLRQPYSLNITHIKENHPLFLMVKFQRENLLIHPLVTSLLSSKWKAYGFLFCSISFVNYFIFITSLTGYIINTKKKKFTDSVASLIVSNQCGFDPKDENVQQDPIAKVSAVTIVSIVGLNLGAEMVRLFQSRLSHLSWVSFLEWITYSSAVLLVMDFSWCQLISGYRHEWQWSVGTFSILLSWLYLLVFIQKIPVLGAYLVMFANIICTFFRFSIIIILCITGFALAFYTLLNQQDQFDTFFRSFVKTAVMIKELYDFEAIFNENKGVMNQEAKYILFFLFLVFIPILTMNLLVGLAVNDIREVQRKFVFNCTAQQIKMILDLEMAIPRAILNKIFYFKQNRPSLKKNHLSRIFSAQVLEPQKLQSAISSEANDYKKLRTTQENLKQTVEGLQETSRRIESMMTAIMKNNNISWQAEDYQEVMKKPEGRVASELKAHYTQSFIYDGESTEYSFESESSDSLEYNRKGSSVHSSGQHSEGSAASIPGTHTTETTESSAKAWGGVDIDELIAVSEEKLSKALVRKVNAIYEFHLEGDNVNVFFLNLKHGHGSVGEGKWTGEDKVDAVLLLKEDDLQQMLSGKLKPFSAYMRGRLKIVGDMSAARRLQTFIDEVSS